MTTQAEIRQASMARQGDFETLFNNILAAANTGDYDKTTRGIILLADQLTEHESIGTWLDIGEFGEFTLADLVVGGYWFYADYHGGQASPEYRALSSLGGVYSPGMTHGPDSPGEIAAYEMLEDLCNLC
jgi:glutathione S-transferase